MIAGRHRDNGVEVRLRVPRNEGYVVREAKATLQEMSDQREGMKGIKGEKCGGWFPAGKDAVNGGPELGNLIADGVKGNGAGHRTPDPVGDTVIRAIRVSLDTLHITA